MSLGIGEYLLLVDDSHDPPLARMPDRVGAVRYRVVAWTGGLIAVKVPGQHYPGGQGQPWPYAPACFEVYRVVKEMGDGSMIVTLALTFPVRS